MAEYNAVYQRAIYYDIVFKRDVSREVQFVKDVYRLHNGRDVESVIDLACGPGYHARAFAAQGVRAVGLDLRGEMLKFAQDEAEKEGVNVEWVEADMRYIQLSQPVDVALAMFDGMDALQSNEDLIALYKAIAANLTPGGLFIAQMSHIDECFYHQYGRFLYTGERDGVSVKIVWATNHPIFDIQTGTALVDVEMHINDHGAETLIKDRALERVLSPQEVGMLTALSGALKVNAWYGDFDLRQPLDRTAASESMIVVMGKR